MMRKHILAGAVMLTMCGAAIGPAQAQVITFDPTNYVQALQQVVQLTQQLRVMQQQYQQLMQMRGVHTRPTQGMLTHTCGRQKSGRIELRSMPKLKFKFQFTCRSSIRMMSGVRRSTSPFTSVALTL